MHYYQFNIGDYKRHTFHLDPLEDIAYRRILDLYYLNDGPVTSDADKLAKQIGMVANIEQVAYVLGEFFELDGDTFRNSRADREIADYAAKADRARANGKKGGRPKPNANPEITQPVIPGIPEGTQNEPDSKLTINHKPLTINQSNTDKDLGVSAKQPQAAKKGSRLVEGFIVPDEWKVWAATEFKGLGSGVDRIAEQFVDYWVAVPGAKGVKLNWFSTWKNWVRRDLDRQRPGPGFTRPEKPASAINMMAAEYQRRLAAGELTHDPDAPF